MARTKMLAPMRRNRGVITTNQVKQMIAARSEHKIFVTSTGATYSTVGLVVPIGLIAADDSLNGRTGLVIRPTSLTVRWNSFNVSSTTYATARLLIFQDRICKGSDATNTEVLQDTIVNSLHNSVNILNNRFKILYDRTVDLGCSNATSGAGGIPSHFEERVIPLKGTISYLTGNGNSAGQGENAIFALYIGNVSTLSLDLRTALRYTDA